MNKTLYTQGENLIYYLQYKAEKLPWISSQMNFYITNINGHFTTIGRSLKI